MSSQSIDRYSVRNLDERRPLPRWRYRLACARVEIKNQWDRRRDPKAALFFAEMAQGRTHPEAHIDALPQQRLIYVCVPKCASTTIKTALSALQGHAAPSRTIHKRHHSGLRSPAQIGVSAFYRLATAPDTLRFSFVRNPYSRLVSTWTDKFRNKPLVSGNSFIDLYLRHRAAVSRGLPAGRGETLSFKQFVAFATETLDECLDPHLQRQTDLTNVPGLALDFIGKVETFRQDFSRVLDHAGVLDTTRQAVGARNNATHHSPWQSFYGDELANRVYRAYRDDFSNYGYSRVLNGAASPTNDDIVRVTRACHGRA